MTLVTAAGARSGCELADTNSQPVIPPVAAVVWTVLSGNLKPPAAEAMVPEQVRLPGTVPPEMSQPVVRSGEVRKRIWRTSQLSITRWPLA